MNLSQYSFLGQIISGMHDIEEALHREISAQTDMLGSPMLFEEIYGNDSADVFFAIDGIYGAYEAALQRLQLKHKVAAIASYSKKEMVSRSPCRKSGDTGRGAFYP